MVGVLALINSTRRAQRLGSLTVEKVDETMYVLHRAEYLMIKVERL